MLDGQRLNKQKLADVPVTPEKNDLRYVLINEWFHSFITVELYVQLIFMNAKTTNVTSQAQEGENVVGEGAKRTFKIMLMVCFSMNSGILNIKMY